MYFTQDLIALSFIVTINVISQQFIIKKVPVYIIIGVLVFINSAFNNATEVKQKRFIFKFESGHLRTNSVME